MVMAFLTWQLANIFIMQIKVRFFSLKALIRGSLNMGQYLAKSLAIILDPPILLVTLTKMDLMI